MKYASLLIPLLLVLTSCYDDYTHDYESPNMGFAVAKPLRTVISDRDMPIYVGVSIGGKREVDLSDWARFVIDPALLEGLEDKELLPSNYYRLSDPEYFRVRKSNLPVADVRIDFTDEFFADELSRESHYVLPLRMTENSLGALREGAETTLVVVRYISTYAGVYYRMGQTTEVDASGQALGDPQSYGNRHDISKCNTVEFVTEGTHRVVRPGLGNDNDGVGSLLLELDDAGNVTVSGVEGAAAVTQASGRYQPRGDYDFVADPGVRAPQFDLEYTYEKEGRYYRVVETLVLRQDPLYDLRVETW